MAAAIDLHCSACWRLFYLLALRLAQLLQHCCLPALELHRLLLPEHPLFASADVTCLVTAAAIALSPLLLPRCRAASWTTAMTAACAPSPPGSTGAWSRCGSSTGSWYSHNMQLQQKQQQTAAAAVLSSSSGGVLQRQHPQQLLIHVWFGAYLSESAIFLNPRERRSQQARQFCLFREP